MAKRGYSQDEAERYLRARRQVQDLEEKPGRGVEPELNRAKAVLDAIERVQDPKGGR